MEPDGSMRHAIQHWQIKLFRVLGNTSSRNVDADTSSETLCLALSAPSVAVLIARQSPSEGYCLIDRCPLIFAPKGKDKFWDQFGKSGAGSSPQMKMVCSLR